jgi:hypothetical protein
LVELVTAIAVATGGAVFELSLHAANPKMLATTDSRPIPREIRTITLLFPRRMSRLLSLFRVLE